MSMEQTLLRTLMRTCAAARRHPHGGHGPHPLADAKKSHGKHRHGMHMGFGHILDLLQTEQGITQQALAEKLCIRPQSVCEAISTLQARSFIEKRPCESDRRKSLIFLTEEGAKKRDEIARHRAQHARAFFAPLSEAEKQTLFALLEKLSSAAENSGEAFDA